MSFPDRRYEFQGDNHLVRHHGRRQQSTCGILFSLTFTSITIKEPLYTFLKTSLVNSERI
jgi:hypothetical protein